MNAPLVVLAPLWFEARALRPALPNAAIVRTGMGAAKSRRAAEDVARRLPGAAAIAVAGVCGALDARLVPGDVVVASELRGAGAPLTLESAKPLARALEARGTRVHLGPILSIERLARRSERPALAVDMESAWLAALADSHRFAVLRVVSDGPGHELFSARVFAHGIRALRALRAAAPALATWADSLEGEP